MQKWPSRIANWNYGSASLMPSIPAKRRHSVGKSPLLTSLSMRHPSRVLVQKTSTSLSLAVPPDLRKSPSKVPNGGVMTVPHRLQHCGDSAPRTPTTTVRLRSGYSLNGGEDTMQVKLHSVALSRSEWQVLVGTSGILGC